MTRCIELLVSRPEQGEDLLVQRCQPEDERGGARIGSVPDVQQLDPLETLEHPAHGRPTRRLLDLVGDGLTRGRQLLAQAVFGQPIDEQAQHHDQAEGDDALGFPRKMISPVGCPHATAGESVTV